MMNTDTFYYIGLSAVIVLIVYCGFDWVCGDWGSCALSSLSNTSRALRVSMLVKPFGNLQIDDQYN